MKAVKTLSILFSTLLLAFVYYNFIAKKPSHISGKPTIALSTFALYDAAKNIAGESMNCFCILPFGVEVHSFEPTPKIMTQLHDADLVVFSGAGLEPWARSFTDANNSLDMSQKVSLKAPDARAEHEGGMDPHYWLDISNMIIVAKTLQERFSQILPQNKALYAQNAQRYISKLQEVDAKYKQKLLTCKKDAIVVDHNAFSYLGKRYGFYVISVSGLSPDAQPSAKVMAEIEKNVQAKQIGTLFFESFASDKVMRAIAYDLHLHVDLLMPLANITKEQSESNSSYASLMLQNLDKIAAARECE